jgi:PAS domain S-box-containing protein
VAELEQKLREVEAALRAAEQRVAAEIAERERRAEEGAELQFQKLAEHSGDVLSIIDPSGRVRYLSPVFARITGIPLETARAEGIYCAMLPDDIPRVAEAFGALVAGGPGAVARLEFRRRHVDGHVIQLEAIAKNLVDDPAVRGIFVSARDVTKRTVAELALRESEARFRALFERTATAVTLRYVDEELSIDCNEAAVRLFGCQSREELLRLHPLAMAAELQADGVSSERARGHIIERAAEESVFQFEWLYRKTTGEIFPAEVQVTVIELNDRKLFLTIITDLTATKAAEAAIVKAKEDAIAASRTKSAFLANMSHELRTPLNGVIGMVDLLSRTALDERQRRYADVARDSARLLLSVINDILDFSKIEAGKLDLERADFSLTDVIEEVAGILEISAEDKGIALRRRCDPALSRPLVGDPARIRQVLVNLVNNAIKFTDRGEVVVGAAVLEQSEAGVVVQIEVRDTGIGIAEDAVPRLFQPFSQVDASTTRQHHGSGLGLAICRELVERMGGQIGVRSAPGAGSTFSFTLPLAKAAPDGEPAEEGLPPRAAAAAGGRILLVEDSPISAELAGEILRTAGYSFDLASNGARAVEAVRREPYDLVLMDCQLPLVDGYEATRRIRALEADGKLPRPAAPIPIVALTASATTGDLERCLAAGMNDYVSKPLDARRLLGLIAAHLSRPSKPPPAPPPRPAPEAAPSPAPAAPRPMVDLAGALSRLQNNRELFARVSARFVESLPSDRALLADAIARRDGRTLGFAAHRLRGQVVTFGAEALGARVAVLEDAAKREDWAAAAAALRAVDEDLDRLVEDLRRLAAGVAQ